jgi:hypothetical protein
VLKVVQHLGDRLRWRRETVAVEMEYTQDTVML